MKRFVQRYGGKFVVNKLAASLLKRGLGIPLLLDAKDTMLVEHVGRKSGKPFETPIGFFRVDDDRLRSVAENGRRSDWARNATAAPSVTVWVEGRRELASARFRDDLDPWEAMGSLGTVRVGVRVLATEPAVVDFVISG